MKRVKITINECKELTGDARKFPKYVSPIINQANAFAQGTRPRVVGQLSDMIQECPFKTYDGWKKWYLEQQPDAIDEATKKIVKMLENFRKVLPIIDEDTVRAWVEDLILVKTFAGLKFQVPILEKTASIMKEDYRLSNPSEESKGIDGFVGKTSISIKPETYRTKPALMEEIEADVIIYYEKKDKYIMVDLGPIWDKIS
jgi:hypothetical protein